MEEGLLSFHIVQILMNSVGTICLYKIKLF